MRIYIPTRVPTQAVGLQKPNRQTGKFRTLPALLLALVLWGGAGGVALADCTGGADCDADIACDSIGETHPAFPATNPLYGASYYGTLGTATFDNRCSCGSHGGGAASCACAAAAVGDAGGWCCALYDGNDYVAWDSYVESGTARPGSHGGVKCFTPTPTPTPPSYAVLAYPAAGAKLNSLSIPYNVRYTIANPADVQTTCVGVCTRAYDGPDAFSASTVRLSCLHVAASATSNNIVIQYDFPFPLLTTISDEHLGEASAFLGEIVDGVCIEGSDYTGPYVGYMIASGTARVVENCGSLVTDFRCNMRGWLNDTLGGSPNIRAKFAEDRAELMERIPFSYASDVASLIQTMASTTIPATLYPTVAISYRWFGQATSSLTLLDGAWVIQLVGASNWAFMMDAFKALILISGIIAGWMMLADKLNL